MNGDPIVDWLYNDDPYYKQSGFDKVKLASHITASPEKYDKIMQAYYKNNYANLPEYADLSYDTFKLKYQETYGNPFEKKKDSSVVSTQPGAISSGASPLKMPYSWGDKKEQKLAMGDYAVSKQDDARRTSALDLVREKRGEDFTSPADQIAIQKAEKDEYLKAQLARRTPMERLLYGKKDDQNTYAQYEYEMKALNADLGLLTDAVSEIDKSLSAKFGDKFMEAHEANVNQLNALAQQIENTPEERRRPEDLRALEDLQRKVEDFQNDPAIIERDKMVGAYRASYNRAQQLLKDGKYETVNQLLKSYNEAQKRADVIENAPLPLSVKIGKFGSDIILKSLAKIPAAIGAIDQSIQGLMGDKKYDTDNLINNWLIDLQSDAEQYKPAPTRYSRPLFTTTAKWQNYQVDFDGDKIQSIRDKRGAVVDLPLDQSAIEDIKKQKKETKFNPAGMVYQTGQLAADVTVQMLATRGIASGATGLGVGANTAAKVGVTLSTMGTMSNQLYDQGLELFDGDRKKASQYALGAGFLVGMSSNLFGLEAKLAGSAGWLDDIVRSKQSFAGKVRASVGSSSVMDIAKMRAKDLLTSGLGEALEETVIETALTRSTAYILGGDPGDINMKDQLATGVLSFATGVLMGGVGPHNNELEKSAILPLAQNPDQFEKVLRTEIEAGRVKLPEESFIDETTAVDNYVQKQKVRFQRIGQQLSSLDLKDDGDAHEVAYLLDQKNDADIKAEKAKVMGMKQVEEIEKTKAKLIEDQILKYTDYAPEEIAEVQKEDEQQQAVAQEVVKETESPTPVEKNKPVNPVVAMTVVLNEMSVGMPNEMSESDFVEEVNRRGEFAIPLEQIGYIARGKKTDQGVEVSVENIETGEVTALGGKVLLDTIRETQGIKKAQEISRMSMKDLSNKVNVETLDDEIAVGFADGVRIKEDDFNRFGDPNTIKDNPAIRTRYTSRTGTPIDQWAAQLAEKWGVDEQDVIQRIIDVVGTDSAGSYLRDRVATQKRSQMTTDTLRGLNDEELQNVDVPNEERVINEEIDAIYANLSTEEISDFLGVVNGNTRDGVTNWDDVIKDLEFLNINLPLYGKLIESSRRENAPTPSVSENESETKNKNATESIPWIDDDQEFQHGAARKRISELRGRIEEKEAELRTDGLEPDAEYLQLQEDLKQAKAKEKAIRESLLNKGQEIGIGAQGMGIVSPGFMSFKVQGWTVQKIKDWLTKFIKETFTSKGGLPQDVFDLNIKRLNYIAAMMKRADYARIDLQRAIKEVYGKPILGEEIMRDLNNALRDPNLMTGGIVLYSDGTRIPQEIVLPLRNMRKVVKSLSTEMVATGVVDGDLAITFIDNMDTYLHRAYKIHSDPDWINKVKGQPVWGRARVWMRGEMNKEIQSLGDVAQIYEEKRSKALDKMLKSTPDMQSYKDAKKAYQYWGGKLNEVNKQIEVLNEKYFDTTQVDNELDRLLQEQSDAFSYGSVSKKGKLGSKDLGILKQRQDLPKELRDLYGEYDDPISTFAQTIYKQAHLSANARFLREVAANGVGKFLFNEDDKRPAGFNVKIASSKTMEPLSGYYTSPEIAEAFATFNEPAQIGNWLKPMIWLSGITKYNKTILSPVTHVRNFVSNAFLHITNGRFGDVKGFAAAMKMAKEDVEAFSKNNAASKEEYARLVELGVLDEGVSFAEVKSLLSDLEVSMEESFNPGENFIKKRWKQGRKLAEELYKNEDNAHRIFAFNFEKNRYAKAKFKKDFNQLKDEDKAWVEDKAVKIIRATMPTYSLISKNVQLLRRIPVVGTFPSFPYESIRTFKNTLDLIKEEYQDKDLRPIAMMRGAGVLATTVGVIAAQQAMFAFMFGDDDDEDKLRWFLPPWSESSVIIPVHKKDADFTYVDVQAVMPLGYTLSWVNALFDRRSENTIGNLTWAILRPFLESDMSLQALSQVITNRDEKGNLISAPDDPMSYFERIKPIQDAMLPGFVTTGQRIVKSVTSPELDYYGRLYPVTELTTLVTGVRFSPGNIEGSFLFRARDFAARAREDKAIYNREHKKQKYQTMSAGQKNTELKGYKKRAIDAWQSMQKDAIKMYSDGVAIGGNPDVLLQHLKDAGFNAEEATAISQGKMIVPKFSDEPKKKK